MQTLKGNSVQGPEPMWPPPPRSVDGAGTRAVPFLSVSPVSGVQVHNEYLLKE